MNYLDFYREVIEGEGAKATFIFSNDPRYIAEFCDNILCCDIHTRNETRDILAAMGKKVYTLADIMNSPVDGGANSSASPCSFRRRPSSGASLKKRERSVSVSA